MGQARTVDILVAFQIGFWRSLELQLKSDEVWECRERLENDAELEAVERGMMLIIHAFCLAQRGSKTHRPIE
jgi:hypothetical protein